MPDSRVLATVTRTAHDRGYVIATDAAGVDYFCYRQNWVTFGGGSLDDCVIGSRVRLTPIEGPKGKRGIEIAVVEE